MNKLLKKELLLAASPLSYYFLAFAAMTMLPGYPILLGSFFVTLGLFQSVQTSREANDIIFSSLLPVAKSEIVKAKFAFNAIIELTSFSLMAILTAVRMDILSDAPVYTSNVMMGANLIYLGFVLLIFSSFNTVFLGGFFKTAYNYGKPFILHIILTFVIVSIGEALHHFPGLEALNTLDCRHLGLQLACLGAGIAVYTASTLLSLKASIRRFEGLDL